ncbi:M14 family metallopeptidase [Nonomuraea lactucae]|uniref:M14 family metallopeptidase n=1 Tax=Nonomuraea lactucae TaxID=2249762 RepID=UPI000DE4D069|nr:M14 metallopeptidase family protein [Nonomuraea lactucae]
MTTSSQAQAAPTPESVIGWAPCADNKLATYEQISAYFQKLDEASNRMRLYDIGKTTEGRTQQLSIISSEENLAPGNLARYKDIARRLALAKDLTDDQARQLAKDGKSIVWLSYGTHSNEVAAHQAAPQVAYELVTGESPEIRAIRDKVITIVVPSINPDGETQMANWYQQQFGKPWSLTLPDMYHKYAGHDDNRDLAMFNLAETRNVGAQLYREWFPQIVFDAHQIAEFPARIFIPPYNDPVNPNIQALTVRGTNLVGSAITNRLSEEGKSGAISHGTYDMWSNSGMVNTPRYHNMVGILAEVAHSNPAPTTYDPKNFPATFRNGDSTSEPSVFYPHPYKGGEWHLSDSCDYLSSVNVGMLELAAKRASDFLYDIYQMGRDAIQAGKDETYVIPADQADYPTAVKFVNTLRRGGIEVEQATAPFTAKGRDYPAGSFLARGAQAFRPHLTDLTNPQRYPDIRRYPGGPLQLPYDVAGTTLAMQMGVKVDKIGSRVEAATTPVELATPAAGQVSGQGPIYALDPRVNDSFIAVNRLLAAGEKVSRTSSPVTTDRGSWPAGTFLVKAGAQTRDLLTKSANELGIAVASVSDVPDATHELKAPRVALYQAYDNNADRGWNRYIFDTFEFPYTLLNNAEIRTGGLKDKYDVIVLPDASFTSMRDGVRAGGLPPEFTGGITDAGMANLKKFVEDGGVTVGMDTASLLPGRAFGVQATDVTAGQPDTKLNIPGSILKIKVDNTQPLGYGMPEEAGAFFTDSPAFSVPEGSNLKTVARYPANGTLLSGFLLGEEIIANTSAVLDAPIGKGHAVLLGFRTQNRAQSHGTYKFLFNSLYLGAMS